jgi:hypothetical protein
MRNHDDNEPRDVLRMTMVRLESCLLVVGYVKTFRPGHAFLVAAVRNEIVVRVQFKRK